MKIVLATRNEGKVKEINEMMAGMGVDLISLKSFKNLPEIIEKGQSYLDNALNKAKVISEMTGETVLADDSGLQVDILDGEPGIYSARYAGEGATDAENNAKLLSKLKDVPQEKRTASFFCALVLYKKDGSYNFFEAKWPGQIIDEGRGNNGFGYDPIFLVPEMNLTAAELPAAIKNKLSHRGQAFAQLKSSLSEKLRIKKIGA
jgi:XTP/dITP diphosphohydrolase